MRVRDKYNNVKFHNFKVVDGVLMYNQDIGGDMLYDWTVCDEKHGYYHIYKENLPKPKRKPRKHVYRIMPTYKVVWKGKIVYRGDDAMTATHTAFDYEYEARGKGSEACAVTYAHDGYRYNREYW